jgi:ribosomal protein L4
MNIELANQATTYDLLNADKLLITEGGVAQIHELFTEVAVAQ